jgi:hypothetical protein
VQCRTKKYDTWFSGGPDLRFRRIKAVGKDGEAVLLVVRPAVTLAGDGLAQSAAL